jgi:ADP-ribosylglycohydrolase
VEGAHKPNHMQPDSSDRRSRAHFSGCLLGGAVGDALSAPVEFLSVNQIRAKYGPGGIADFDQAYGRRGAITDDTQMTLFTAEGVLRADVRWHYKAICHPASVIHHAYIRWLHTQGASLHARRAPGNTCLSALRGATMGAVDRPLNNSKGCGGVMRVAPIGLAVSGEEAAFTLGSEAAAITHGHPSGYYSAGCFAAIIQNLTEGGSVPDAIDRTLRILDGSKNANSAECSTAIRQAVALWQARVGPAPETIERMGGGWVWEEALAIALCCALTAQDDFARGVLLAVNHSGDSDSTGAIAGNLLGLMLGIDAIPRTWLDELELREEIETVADDLCKGFDESDAWLNRYPGW